MIYDAHKSQPSLLQDIFNNLGDGSAGLSVSNHSSVFGTVTGLSPKNIFLEVSLDVTV